MRKKRKRMPYTASWERDADREARVYAPPIKPCEDCGQPTVYGYICRFCPNPNTGEVSK